MLGAMQSACMNSAFARARTRSRACVHMCVRACMRACWCVVLTGVRVRPPAPYSLHSSKCSYSSSVPHHTQKRKGEMKCCKTKSCSFVNCPCCVCLVLDACPWERSSLIHLAPHRRDSLLPMLLSVSDCACQREKRMEEAKEKSGERRSSEEV